MAADAEREPPDTHCAPKEETIIEPKATDGHRFEDAPAGEAEAVPTWISNDEAGPGDNSEDETGCAGNGDATALAEHVSMGRIEAKLPAPAKLIETSTGGEVPANQLVVILADRKNRADADQIAETLGGAVVGELEFLNAYQIENSGSTEADLAASLSQAAALEGVELAFPNQQVFPA